VGFLTDTREVIVLGGTRESVTISLIPLHQAGTQVRRWRFWKPLAVVVAGGVVAGAGGLLQWQSIRHMEDYDRAIGRECADGGCSAEELAGTPTAALKRRALLENKLAVGMLATGGAALVTGAVLMLMNRSHTVYPDASTSTRRPAAFQLSPLPGGAALGVDLRF
jgi:hypothetical protein